MSAGPRTYLLWILKANLAVWAANVLLFVIVFFARSGFSVTNFFSLVTLLETALFLLIGGALAFLGAASTHKIREQMDKHSGQWTIERLRKSEKRANKYLLLAAILFVECLIVSFL